MTSEPANRTIKPRLKAKRIQVQTFFDLDGFPRIIFLPSKVETPRANICGKNLISTDCADYTDLEKQKAGKQEAGAGGSRQVRVSLRSAEHSLGKYEISCTCFLLLPTAYPAPASAPAYCFSESANSVYSVDHAAKNFR